MGFFSEWTAQRARHCTTCRRRSLAKSIIVTKMSSRAGGIARISLVELFFGNWFFAQTARSPRNTGTTSSITAACWPFGADASAAITVSAGDEFGPVLPLAWLERTSGIDAPHEVLLTAGICGGSLPLIPRRLAPVRCGRPASPGLIFREP